MVPGPVDGARLLRPLPHAECLELLGGEVLGHLAYTSAALPAVAPVRCALVGGEILVAAPDDRVCAAARGSVVALQVGSLDLGARTGWSVTAVGPARAVRDGHLLPRWGEQGLEAWSPSCRGVHLRVEPTLVSGWRIGR